MLKEFWTKYAQIRINSELVKIKQGKYIVSVTIEVDNSKSINCLGVAQTIEEAEKQARDRAMSLIGLTIDENIVEQEELLDNPISSENIERENKEEEEINSQELLRGQDQEQKAIDFSDIRAKISTELTRLRLNREEGRALMIKLYGKNASHLLTNEELLNFLQYLKAMDS